MDEHEARLRRLRMRSWRRGTREMDLILGPYADAHLAAMDAATLDAYEALLEENDQDLYPWITARMTGAAASVPPHHGALLDRIAAHAGSGLRGPAGA